jgi:hypothetical protein
MGCATDTKDVTVTDNVNTTETVDAEGENPELSQEELADNTMKLIAKVMSSGDLDLALNNNESWVINKDTYDRFMKMKQQIYVISGNMESYEVSSYNEMGKEFFDFAKEIQPEHNEGANLEVQKVVSAVNEQCLLMLGSDLQQSQIAVINLSIIFEEVPSFFISE